MEYIKENKEKTLKVIQLGKNLDSASLNWTAMFICSSTNHANREWSLNFSKIQRKERKP